MKFRQWLNESLKGTGDCYKANADYLMKLQFTDEKKLDDYMLVHGLVTGQGKIQGVRYTHCWLENGNDVIDKSNGKELKLPKRIYYNFGKIKEKDLVRYTPKQAFEQMVSTGVYGPWDKKFNGYP